MRADPLVLRLERRVCDFVARRGVLRAGERVLLMLSGGADSMAMLALVRRRRPPSRARPRLVRPARGLRPARGRLDARPRDRRRAPARRPASSSTSCGSRPAARTELPGARARAALRAGAGARRRARLRRDRRRRTTATTRPRPILYRLAKYASPQALVGMRPREAGAPGRAALARPLLCLGRGRDPRLLSRARGIEFGEDVTNARARVRAQRRAPRDPPAARGAEPSRRRDARRGRRDRRRRARGARRASRTRPGRVSPPPGRGRRRRGPRAWTAGARAGGAARALPARPHRARARRGRARRATRDRGPRASRRAP